jgi:hypothetical protein
MTKNVAIKTKKDIINKLRILHPKYSGIPTMFICRELSPYKERAYCKGNLDFNNEFQVCKTLCGDCVWILKVIADENINCSGIRLD